MSVSITIMCFYTAENLCSKFVFCCNHFDTNRAMMVAQMVKAVDY